MDPKTGIIYCRVSSEEQVDGTSLVSQERLCREYAARHNIEVLAVFVDAGESAKTANRPELSRAITFCKRKRAHFFIVYKIDRFARNQTDHVTVRAFLRQSGTELRSVTEPIDESPIGRAMEGMLSVFAEFDNNVRTERTKQGMLERVRNGVWVWTAPIGYRRHEEGGNLVPDPETAPLIKFAFTEYVKGTYSFERLGNVLAEAGLRTKQGRRPTHRAVYRIITNPVYAGIIRVWGEDFDGSFEPLVSKKLFAACQPTAHRSASPHAAPRSLNNPNFPLRGLVTCALCGKTLTGSYSRGSKGTKYPYYHHYSRACSSTASIPKDTLEKSFQDVAEEFSIHPDAARRLSDIIRDKWQEILAEAQDHNALVKKEITALEAERQRVFDLHRSGTYSDSEFSEQKRRVEGRIQQKTLSLLDRGDLDFELGSV